MRTLKNNFESIEDMLEELSVVSEAGGLVENVVLLARVIDDDDEERLFLGWSPDVFDDPTKTLGHLELVKSRLFEVLSIRERAH